MISSAARIESKNLNRAVARAFIMASTENLTLSNLSRAVASGYEENGLQRVQSRYSHPHELHNEHVSTPKADGGKDAWLFLAGCFCIEALTWGECMP